MAFFLMVVSVVLYQDTVRGQTVLSVAQSSTGKSSPQSNTVSRNLPLLAMKIIHVTTAMHNLNALYGLVVLPASSSSSSSSTPVTSVLQSYCRHHFIMHILSVKTKII